MRLYRKASKLCHPDVLPHKLAKEAETIFKELNNAYNIKNIYQIKVILSKLEGDYFETFYPRD